MRRVEDTLRALLDRALIEHAQEPPALTEIIIERARGGSEPRLGAQFSNGYHSWAQLRPSDCYAFCDRHSAWDVESLRRALLREAHDIYAGMLAEERARGEHRRQLTEQIRRLGAELRRVYQPPPMSRLLGLMNFGRRSLFGDGAVRDAEVRGLRLLKENLTPAQRKQYAKQRCFEIVGGQTGRRYRIRHGRLMNIEQLDKKGRRVCGWCFFPKGRLVAGDVMLAQKIALELFELEALQVANKFYVERSW
jgi:hypothetical protein